MSMPESLRLQKNRHLDQFLVGAHTSAFDVPGRCSISCTNLARPTFSVLTGQGQALGRIDADAMVGVERCLVVFLWVAQ